jgi:hypothetical protein
VLQQGQLTADTTVVAGLNSPAFTGTPTAPTPPAGDSSNAVATTAFVQGTAVRALLPPATVATLGGIKIGAGLTAQTDGTTALAATLPGVDGSAVTVRSTIAGAAPRTLADMRGEYIQVADLLGARPTGQDATAAMQAALAIAAAKPGCTIVLCEGQWNFASMTSTFAVPSGTTIKGAGANQTLITWNDTTTANLFGSTGTSASPATDIHFEDFMVTGSWATNGVASTAGQYPLLLGYVNGLTFRNVCSQYSRVMGIVARSCVDVTAENCTVRYCARDGISFAECAAITVAGCTVEHCDDDGITAHANIYDPWLVRRNVVISGNRVFGSQGIKVLAGRNFSITGNVIDCCRAQGISVCTVAADNVSTEGETAAQVGSITGNIITNTINRQNIDGLNKTNPGIIISGDAARAGSLGTIPGEASTASASVIDPYPYVDVNSNQSSTATPGSFGIIVSGNVIARTLPACNSSSTNPATGRPFAAFTDYGFGQMFTRNGWLNPTLAESDLRGDAISISGGVVRDVLITGNVIRGMYSGLALNNAVRLENIVFRGNEVVDCYGWGVLINTSGTLRAYIEDNLIDLDPYMKHPNRGPHGTWLAVGGGPDGIHGQTGSGVFVRRNIFRNLCRDSTQASDQLAAGWLFEGNIIEADPAGVGFSTASKGVGYLRNGGGTLLCQVDSDPGSATFGQVLNAPAVAAPAQPANGKWVVGHVVRNDAPAVAGGVVNLGWVRLTTGSNNNAGSDWAQALAVAGTVAASQVLAGPTASSAVPAFRQLGAADITGLATVATSGSYNDLANKPAIPAVPPSGMVYSTGSAFASATIGAGLSYSSGVLSAQATVPAPGMVYSTGSALAACTVGFGLSYSGGVLSTQPMAITSVSNTYAASGAIAPTDNVALVNAASAVAMTLAAGPTDGHVVTVKRLGAGAVTLTATVDGVSGMQIPMNSASLKEAVTLVWNAANATWLMF